MPKINVTVQALLENNQSGPHFQIQLDAEGYADALAKAIVPLNGVVTKSGFIDTSFVATAKRLGLAEPTPTE